MTVSQESKESYKQKVRSGAALKIDEIVFKLIHDHHEPLDAREAHAIFKAQGHPLGADMKYNDVQQAFTRLTNEKRIIKVGTHKNNFTGRTVGVYRVRRDTDAVRQDMFLSDEAVRQHEQMSL